jgi:Protein of unknown function (DUF1153)
MIWFVAYFFFISWTQLSHGLPLIFYSAQERNFASKQRWGERGRNQNYAAADSRFRQQKSPWLSDLFGRVQDPRKNWLNSIIEQSLLRSPPMDDLPPPNTTRWVTRRKAAVVVAVRSGKITIEEALRRYQLSEEEFLSWQRVFETHGLAGLRATRVQQYRSRPPRGPRSRRWFHLILAAARYVTPENKPPPRTGFLLQPTFSRQNGKIDFFPSV